MRSDRHRGDIAAVRAPTRDKEIDVSRIRDIMAEELTTVPASSTVSNAAMKMRDGKIGDVLVVDDRRHVTGILTDRDIVVRALAEHADPDTTRVGDVCSSEVVTIDPDEDVHEAVKLLRHYSIRRLPVVDDGALVGIVSMGDLAREIDRRSALAEISSADSNN